MKSEQIYPTYAGRTLTLIGEDDREIQCQVLVVFRPKEDEEQRYIALLEIKEHGVSNDLMIYRFFEEEDGAPSLEPIQTDVEYTDVANFLGQYLDEMEAAKAASGGGCGCGCDPSGCSGCH
ncbi:MAG: DUF1292 domain-containing protein [Eubacteriales bacterium]|nr:DUF1292 domain-containing protein [Eubacteriales bacterium]